eukprot:104996-Pleurochrysis_carterae.AAC.4
MTSWCVGQGAQRGGWGRLGRHGRALLCESAMLVPRERGSAGREAWRGNTEREARRSIRRGDSTVRGTECVCFGPLLRLPFSMQKRSAACTSVKPCARSSICSWYEINGRLAIGSNGNGSCSVSG